jgi:hypothetical protein
MNPKLVLKPPFIFPPVGANENQNMKEDFINEGLRQYLVPLLIPPRGGKNSNPIKKLCYVHRFFSHLWGEMS